VVVEADHRVRGVGLFRDERGDAHGELLAAAGVVQLRARDAVDPAVHVQDRADIRMRLVDHPVLDRVH
jgi:hypothetical protein